ncbi:MAG: ATP phosphoribosyltransferase regulatory subunit [Hydrogenophaga sp.]|uniref:ATP phosphoribosyltransferase regulatory subunit n=1 Tax=Hydrogenophaga sp. TaxID=1904254 RepID=UPI001BBACDD5|nr:ATP phosphoribosyltransferase regulatory subunit [Hydrogenophaga sp.]MBS3911458.1 ATP phosphoribosyltransferase regulatory subunit [Hydrogenophaga sp.]MDO9148642.1 ATP phosphoribosyltransferase regulatory subunit [Hydrogenophaga sp.]MDO9605309.1 ATP phosphoribosyltransferase regulatory subunit [Hydrogenophaga sp.]MDP2163784.1 ATP phosphoribosyltransferase regulatory subunit [Hydrogenophaga sp.]MDP3474907.1 ATP phosphoribosyltransferase regulatory subunit [Hydrogenophaga sp.]
MSAWVLPDHIADVLPSEARHIEELRRGLLDTARGYGYELVMPPLIEHLESLLTGTGEALDLQTFKLVDQLSGRTLGLRADSTPQVARIDAHLLNRQGVARLSYCGPVVHTRLESPLASREPLQFGAEIYGHAGLEADLEIIELAQACLLAAGVGHLHLDMADVRVIDAVLSPVRLSAAMVLRIHAALAAKDVAELDVLARDLPAIVRRDLCALPRLFGDLTVLDEARQALQPSAELHAALDNLRWLASHAQGVDVSIDLADLRGYAYYTGMRFALFASGQQGRAGQSVELARGGRYDEVGAVFGRKRPAVGFSLDLKDLVSAVSPRALVAAIRAPWGMDADLREAVAALRLQGHTVVCVLPGHEQEVDEFHCDRELTKDTARANAWTVRNIQMETRK